MAIAIDAFIGLSIEDVLDIEAKAVAASKSGGGIIAWSSAGSSVSKQLDGSPAEVLRAVRFAKSYLAPDIYGRNITRTIVSHGRASQTVTNEEAD